MIKIVNETGIYKNTWGKEVDISLKYTYENVNKKHNGECISYKLTKEELYKEIDRLNRGKHSVK
ncbi:MAG: hypothetical protein ACRCX8_16790, partial [Sarcina sp.]